MMKSLLLSFAAILFTLVSVEAQNDDAARIDEIIIDVVDSAKVWTIGGGIGLDLGNILVINPRAGSGQNRIGIGGAIGLYANKREGRFSWDNNVSLNLGLEKTGSGVLPIPNKKIKVPYRKTIDDLRLNSLVGYKFNDDSKWSYAVELNVRTQLVPGYLGVEDGQVYIKHIEDVGPYENTLVSKFFAPARVNLGLGITYEHDSHLSFFFMPATLDLMIVADQEIANLGIHGTELKDGSTTEYEQLRVGLGARFGAKYENKFFNERLSFISRIAFFSDYLHEPKNIDMDWSNEVGVKLFKNVTLTYQNNLYYDDDILSFVTDFDSVGGLKLNPDGTPITRPTLNYYHQILIKYARAF